MSLVKYCHRKSSTNSFSIISTFRRKSRISKSGFIKRLTAPGAWLHDPGKQNRGESPRFGLLFKKEGGSMFEVLWWEENWLMWFWCKRNWKIPYHWESGVRAQRRGNFSTLSSFISKASQVWFLKIDSELSFLPSSTQKNSSKQKNSKHCWRQEGM